MMHPTITRVEENKFVLTHPWAMPVLVTIRRDGHFEFKELRAYPTTPVYELMEMPK